MKLKLPICTFDAKTGVLCPNCKRKLQQGEISDLDVEMSKLLAKNQNKIRDLARSVFSGSFDTQKLAIMVGNDALREVVEGNTKLHEELEKVANKSVEVVVRKGTTKETIATLFHPMEVGGIDEIFVPDGTKELRINLRGKESDLPMAQHEIELIASKLTDSYVRLHFSKTNDEVISPQ